MSVSGLRTLMNFAAAGSFARTADQMRISQAAVGQRIKRLEEALGVSLVSHDTRPPLLTAVGQDLVRKSSSVVERYDELLANFMIADQFCGEIIIGAYPSTILELVPRAVLTLKQSHPSLQVRIIAGASSSLPVALERGQIDLAVTSQPKWLNAAFDWSHLAHEPLVLITAPTETLEDPIEILAARPFVRHDPSENVGQLADDWLARNGVSVVAEMEMASLDTLVSMVSHGLGVSIVPEICAPDGKFSKLRRLALPNAGDGRDIGILSRKGSSKNKIVAMFCDAALAVLTK